MTFGGKFKRNNISTSDPNRTYLSGTCREEKSPLPLTAPSSSSRSAARDLLTSNQPMNLNQRSEGPPAIKPVN